MKKMGLFCAALLACGSLAGCGLQKHHSDKEAASISKLKSENSSLKAKKSSHHKHKKAKSSSEAETSNQTNSTKKSSAQGNNGASDATANKLRNMDPKYWDSLSASEKAYWIRQTQASGNDAEEYFNSAGFIANKWAQQGGMPSNSSTPSNGGNSSGYIPSNDDWHVYPDTGYTPSVPVDD